MSRLENNLHDTFNSIIVGLESEVELLIEKIEDLSDKSQSIFLLSVALTEKMSELDQMKKHVSLTEKTA